MPSCKTTCAYCGVGCGVTVNNLNEKDSISFSQHQTLTVSGDSDHTANSGDLCGKGLALIDSLNIPNKLLYPRRQISAGIDDSYQNISWPAAVAEIAEKFSSAIAEHGPDSVAFYLSGQLLTEDYYVANKLAKGFLATANVDTNSRLCMSSAVSAHIRAFGEDVVPGCYEDLLLSDVVVLVGANTAWTHPVLFKKILAARAERGTKIVVIDPRLTATASQADLHLQLTPGSDLHLFNGLLCAIADKGQSNREYINSHTEGFEQAVNSAREDSETLANIAHLTGLKAKEIDYFYALYQQGNKVVTASSQGVNQSTSGTNTANAIINCHLARGDIGQVGCGPLSLTGQPNAMGGREVGGLATQLACHLGFSEPERRLVEEFWQTTALPKSKGLTATEMFADMAEGKIKAVWVLGTNPAVSMPDTELVKKALQRCDYVVVSDITADTDTAKYADLLLPAQGWSEKSGTVTNSERTISRQRGFIQPQGESKADWWALCEVAKALGFTAAFEFKDSADIFNEYARLTVKVQQQFPHKQLSLAGLSGLSASQYEQLLPTQWPVNDFQSIGQRDVRLFSQGQFATTSGKAQFVETRLSTEGDGQAPMDSGSLSQNRVCLNSGRSRDQWHTMTRTGHIEQLAASHYQPELTLNIRTLKKHGLEVDGLVAIKTENLAQPLIARVVIDESQLKDTAFLSMHWSTQFSKSGGVNRVVTAAVDPFSKQPGFKNQWVELRHQQVVEQGIEWGQALVDTKRLCWDVKQQLRGGVCRHIAAESNISASIMAADLHHKLSSQRVLQWRDQDKQIYCIIYQGKLKSLLITAEHALDIDVNAIQSLINNPLNAQFIKHLHQVLRAGSSKIVCACTGVTEKEIEQQMCADFDAGATTIPLIVDAVQQKLKCSAVCGSCLNQVKDLANAVIADKQKSNREVA
ncbi:molybdopterin-dependent oxidoreductase [Shewanella sp. KX20019]|uniref:nitrate reductase n=1 Tax=Shewanella sp. KX20019 TaxID=2803864 RepID=UPI0019262BA1|nr:molybdopterin-dependent oxidoreductase [Shewanella sp. KX20019]QQX82089.1 molybdopterin-dependent oxidoreductase [Shewanella sp. KX20019]